MEDKPKRYLWYVNWVKSHTDGKEFGTEVIQTEDLKLAMRRVIEQSDMDKTPATIMRLVKELGFDEQTEE